MFYYDIGILLLIKRLKLTYPDLTYPLHADDAEALGTFDNLGQYFNLLKRNSPAWGY